ncbi:MAG: hypothetical protein SF052_22840 [Bacteroidia bacterium]|nr:hypothetical protein [Bacteroidia bacterium]
MIVRYLFLWFLLMAASVESWCQSPLNDLFASDSLLHLRLLAPLPEFLADRSENAPGLPATLFYPEGDSSIRLDCEIEVKGNFRRQPQNCAFPPVKIKFEKTFLPGTCFEKHRKLKLIPHCTDESYVLREYLAYRMLHELTPYSFQVRLVKITYEDVLGRTEPLEKFAFLVEDEDRLAERMGGKLVENQNLSPDSTQKEQTLLVYLFQYMIGNTDWDVKIEKNIKLIQHNPDTPPVIVPYDFDWSGWVNAPYTDQYMENFERRRFAALCRSEAEFAAVFEKFHQARPQLETLLDDFPGLNKKMLRENQKYLQQFYQDITDPRTVKEKFIRACR